jgi:hypothetical protein
MYAEQTHAVEGVLSRAASSDEQQLDLCDLHATQHGAHLLAASMYTCTYIHDISICVKA